jgi:hypothetical protein
MHAGRVGGHPGRSLDEELALDVLHHVCDKRSLPLGLGSLERSGRWIEAALDPGRELDGARLGDVQVDGDLLRRLILRRLPIAQVLALPLVLVGQ